MAGSSTVLVNRAPVLTLWACILAERMGYDSDAALTLGKAVAGLNAQTKGRMLGIYKAPPTTEGHVPPRKRGLGENFWVELCGRPVPVKYTEDGMRAVVKDKPISPDSVQRYLESKFGESLEGTKNAMRELAGLLSPDDLASRAYGLYEQFRPDIPTGKRGWGVKGELDLGLIRSLSR